MTHTCTQTHGTRTQTHGQYHTLITEADPDDMGAYAGDDDAPMYRHEEAEEGDEFERYDDVLFTP